MIELPELVPARMLNEFTYCPRLAYLEWVQSEFSHNPDTLDGNLSHRRVDVEDNRHIPAASDIDESDDSILHSRSVMLSAPSLGIIAKMDILELEGLVATPVDYKKGAAPIIPEGAYDPERVQLCAQALILRENGFTCDSGIIYFVASKTRVEIEFDSHLITLTMEMLSGLRASAASKKIPLPLTDSPKCPRCSLVGICLPDETGWLMRQSTEDSQDDKIRRLLPARDDALPAYVQFQGAQVGKSADRLTVKLKGELIQEIKLHDLSQLCLFGNVQLTTQALHELASRQIPICYFSMGGWFHAVTNGLGHKNIDLRMEQFSAAVNQDRSLLLARAFVFGKIRNSRTLLRRLMEKDSDIILDRLADLCLLANDAPSTESLLGIEGTAARIYFSGFAQIIKGGDFFKFEDRNRRPPKDPINAVLSFLYSMLAKEWTVTLTSVGFDPMLGFYHKPRYGRPALALDLTEEFRPLIADSVTLSLVNSGELSNKDFVFKAGACSLNEKGRKTTIAAFERRLDSLITHPIFGYKISYRRIFEVQARLLARTLSGELSSYPSFLTR